MNTRYQFLTTALVAACLAGGTSANAALIAYDGFDGYTTSSDLNTQGPAKLGFTGSWGGDANIDASASDMTYTLA